MSEAEGQSRTLLMGFYKRMRALRDERASLTADLGDVRKEARRAGFDATKIEEVCRWMEKIDKHGRDRMDEAEAIFDLYRQIVDGRGAEFEDMMNNARDRALLKIFAPDDQVAEKINQRTKTMRNAVVMAQAAKRAREM